MATRGERAKVPKLQSITTAEILKRLTEQGGDNTEFFYLYVSTAGKERKKRQQRAKVPPQGQQQLPFLPQNEDDEITDSDDDEDIDDQDDDQDDDRDDEDDDRDDQDDMMDSQDNSTYNQDDQSGVNASLDSQPSQSSSMSLPLSKDNTRKDTMTKVHKEVLPILLEPNGWKKVFDKDTKLTYRALYFNKIKKNSDEDVPTFVQRVGQIRHKIAYEAKKLMKENNVNFKINSLLSKPFLYDEVALEEQTMRATQTQPPGMKQTTLDDFQ